ncbi:uncharacterized protein LOC124540250 [Vanessa cardui]|uniref:uncharacterized protein LOC124540250 n=1 Tax=Vanessa cardui TaxID=171605 RepID=UPI001F12EAE5|nr:uncharacterized protein LOC124540250 [Vanessa cardui]
MANGNRQPLVAARTMRKRRQVELPLGVRVPPFWPDEPDIWFAQLEGQFMIAGITNDATKFFYVVSQLDRQYARAVKDIITNPTARDKYEKLKSELIRRLSASNEKKVQQLLMHEELGDRRPSQFLRHLQGLVDQEVTNEFLRTIWTSRLPGNIQSILAAQPHASLDTLACLPASRTESTTLCRHQLKMSLRGAAPIRDPASTEPRSVSVPATSRRRKTLWAVGNRDNSPITSGRLFVTDKWTKTQFLVDTGSDLCVFPLSMLRERREPTTYKLTAVNGSTINTYGYKQPEPRTSTRNF